VLTTERFQAHPDYNSATQQNDIAVIRVGQDIVFSLQVGPACLPFRFPTTSVGTVVNVLGKGFNFLKLNTTFILLSAQKTFISLHFMLHLTLLQDYQSTVKCELEDTRGADKSLARPTSRCFLFDFQNISFDASLVLYIYIISIQPLG
jgi:hypothetical protein